MGSIAASLVGLCAGAVSGGALCAFYIALGIFTKSTIGINIRNVAHIAAISSGFGVIFGALITLFPLCIPSLSAAAGVFGALSGIYVGIFIGCLADVVSAIPVVKRIGIPNRLLRYVFLSFGLGKLAGSLIYWMSGLF